MLDKKDTKILDCLKINCKRSTQEISKSTLIPITTVHHRIKSLEKRGIIKGYSVILDKKKLGKIISAYILITVDYNQLKESKASQHDLARRLKKHEAVEETVMLTGGTDIMIKVNVKDIDELDEFVTVYLRNINGVEKTRTMILLHEF